MKTDFLYLFIVINIKYGKCTNALCVDVFQRRKISGYRFT